MPAGDEPPPGVANVNPVGAVDKEGKDKYSIIQDERLANLGVDDWGMRLFSVRELTYMLNWCSITYGDNIRVEIMFRYAVATSIRRVW